MESNLSLKKADFLAKIALYFGWGEEPDEWDERKQSVLKDCAESGYRQFLYPPPVGGIFYDWSFLKPVATLTLAAATSTLTLPDDFGGIEGNITVATPASRWKQPIPIVNEGIIRELHGRSPEQTGVPQMASVRAIQGVTPDRGQRFQLYWFPTTDVAFTAQVAYYHLGSYLDGTHQYFVGGSAHTETILESCLSIAEQRYDDIPNGVHSQKFFERLAASVAVDRRYKPQTGLRNTDNSDFQDMAWNNREAVTTYNSVLWE